MPRYRAGYKRSSVTSSTGAVSENAVVFQSSGGHTHDGSNSSLIETDSYSVWDFQVNTVYSTTPRADRQNRHIEQFKNFISNHVNNNVLEPAGVVLGENVINATNIISNSITTDVIAANAITANEIAAATITTSELATDAIQSLNFSYSSGLYSNAGSFFNLADGTIRTPSMFLNSSGDLYLSNSVVIGATTANTIVDGAAAGANAIPTGGAANDVNTANVTVSGTKITSNSITTTQLATDSIKSTNYSYTSGDYSTAGTFFDLTDGSITSKQFAIDSSGNASFAGDISAASGTFTGDLNGADISGGTIIIGSSNTVFKVSSTGNMWLGNAVYSSAPFRVSNSGNLVATSATITGTINATAGYIGNSSYGFNIANFTNYSTLSSNDNTGSGASRGKVDIRSYGDISITSTPVDGVHDGQSYKTSLVGEWITIQRTDGASKPQLYLGNLFGDSDTMELNFYQNDSIRSSFQMFNGYGRLRLFNSSGDQKIWLSGQDGDARFYRDVTVDDDLSVGDDCTVGGNLYASINDTNAIRTRVNTSGGLGVIRTGAGNANYTPITINTEHGGLSGPAYYMISFYHYDVNKGAIFHNGSNTTYGTSSDYRLKENIQTITDGLGIIKKIKPRYYTFIDNEEAGVQIGFIAHELQEVVPQAAFGIKDAVDEEGNPVLQQIEKSAIVPHLVSAIQELAAEVETLKAQVASFSN